MSNQLQMIALQITQLSYRDLELLSRIIRGQFPGSDYTGLSNPERLILTCESILSAKATPSESNLSAAVAYLNLDDEIPF